MNKHRKKMIAPIVITVLVVLYYVVYFVLFVKTTELSQLVKLLLGIIPLLLAGTSIFVLVERIKEIRSGEEDDLSQY